jgi:hypothetical protein
MRILTLALPLAAALGLGACAAGGADAPQSYATGASDQCFYNSDVRSFTDGAPNVVLVAVGADEAWELTLQNGCPDVGAASKVAIRSRGATRICAGQDAEITVPNVSGAGAQRCLVRSVRKLSAQEAAAVRN